MMKKSFLVSCLTVLGLLGMQAGETVTSPDGRIKLELTDGDGKPCYQVSYNNQVVIGSSALGLLTNIGDLSRDIKLKKVTVNDVTDEYSLRTIKQSHVSYQAREAVAEYEQKDQPVMNITFRVSNRDVAFRYTVLSQKKRGGETLCCELKEELTAFQLPAEATTFMAPQSKPMTGFARTAPSYETTYTIDEPVGKNGWGNGYTFPCLFRVPGKAVDKKTAPQDTWVLISETGTDGSYVGCRLLNEQGGRYRIGFPQADEMNGWGSTSVQMALPGTTPWRTITIGTIKDVVETTVSWDVVQPKYQASRQYEYGKGSWSWIIGMDSSCNFDEQKRYIDFSAAMGYRSVLIDALWDVQIGYERMAELARYGKSKGVGIFLWYNSNGSWNDAPQSPRGIMDNSYKRRQEMAWMQKTGILGIKVDFFGGDKQPMMKLYEEILSDANDYGLQVIFHGCTLPRGWERMYPNYVASEAILASENLHFSQGFCDSEARNCGTMYPFTRNVVGSMDFGGSALNKYYNANNNRGSQRKTSDIYALATAVIFQSSVQHFALAPNNLTDAPAWAVEFMKQVPTTWDEVRFIDGYPGSYCIMARRTGQTWYIAGISAREEPVKMKFDLTSFFKKGAQLTAYTDAADLNGTCANIKSAARYTLTIPANGGFVIVGDAQ